jgi:hypothetical protein
VQDKIANDNVGEEEGLRLRKIIGNMIQVLGD